MSRKKKVKGHIVDWSKEDHVKDPKTKPGAMTSPLRADKPGESPQPADCICTWTPLSLGWKRGQNSACPSKH